MGTQSTTIEILDHSGGRNSRDPEFLVPLNQATDLQNVNLLTRGWQSRLGNSAFNSVVMDSSFTPITGLGYIEFTSGTEFLNAVAAGAFYTSSGMTGTMTDNTGAVSITAGQNNKWTPVLYNDMQIWFGGGPDAPFKYTGSGDAAALGGSPPSAKTAFAANNRIFAISTTANPSIVQWNVLGDEEDWTGTGSGSQEVRKKDGEELLFGVVINADLAILFKNTSTHYMPLTSAPFPVYQLQDKEGAAGRYSWVFVDGVIYFITPSRRMKATADGRSFVDFPSDVDDLWDTVNTSQIKNIYGVYYPNLYQIHWFVATGSSTKNNASIIWDIKRKAWLYNPSGFKANVATLAQNRRLFTGHYNGVVYEQDKANTYSDASEGGAAIDAYWRYPAIRTSTVSGTNVLHWIDVVAQSQTTGTFTVSYGFDFSKDQKSGSLSLVGPGAVWDVDSWDVGLWGGSSSLRRRIFTNGNGENFNLMIRNNASTHRLIVQAVSLKLKSDRVPKIVANR